MATSDVPGANPANKDKLAVGSWAEHSDGSLIFVEGTEKDIITYSLFDVKPKPPIEYRDRMARTSFELTFSFAPTGNSRERWTWHDKTPFDWERVIGKGLTDGPRLASASDTLTAAQRVAESLRLRGIEVERGRYEDRAETTREGPNTFAEIGRRLGSALDRFIR